MKKYFTIPAVALVLLSFLLLSAVSWKKKHQDIILHPVSFDDKENLASKYDSLEIFIQEQVTINAIPALAAAMIQNGKVVWMKGFGVQNIDTKAPATEETLFVTSSIAKLVVAVAVMQQKEQGKLNLDEDISKYLGYTVRNPNYPDIKITPRLLLTHQAGLSNPNQNEVPELTGFHVDTVINMKDWIKDFIIPSGAHYKPAIWQQVQPGTIHSSSNMGVTLLAHIVEKITGQDFRDYSTKYIFSKLKMDNTAYKMHLPGSFDPEKLADIYTINGTKLVDYIESPIYAAGLLRTSIKDWSKFMIAIMNGGVYEGKRILKQTSVDEMLDVKYPNAGLAFDSGVGLMWRAYGTNKDWLGHTGGGFISASADVNIQQKTSVIILTNGRGKLAVMPHPNGVIYHKLHTVAMQNN